MSPENKKIALIVGALLVVSFLNFQVNNKNLTAQIFQLGLFQRFTNFQSPINDYPKVQFRGQESDNPKHKYLKSQENNIQQLVRQQFLDLKSKYNCPNIKVTTKDIFICLTQDSFTDLSINLKDLSRFKKDYEKGLRFYLKSMGGYFIPDRQCILLNTGLYTDPLGNLSNQDMMDKILSNLRHECFHDLYENLVSLEQSSDFINEGFATMEQENDEILKRVNGSIHKKLAYKNDVDKFYQLLKSKQGQSDEGASFALFLCLKYKSCKDGLEKISEIIEKFETDDKLKLELSDSLGKWSKWENDLDKENNPKKLIKLIQSIKKTL